ncbi:MAG: HNH endonuclease [Nitrososphaera sp.]|nr:HNH endonuclease [Nitrososphaera sp.]
MSHYTTMNTVNPLCRHCQTALNDDNWYPSQKKGKSYLCKTCHNAANQRSREQVFYPVNPVCRQCKTALDDDNWCSSWKKKRDYICKSCSNVVVRRSQKRKRKQQPFYRATIFTNRRAPGVVTEKMLSAIYDNQQHLCFYCKADMDVVGWHLDHLLPVSKGGTNDPDNLAFACGFCNRAKNDHSVEEYLHWLAGVIERGG